jgi:hypothetical protein
LQYQLGYRITFEHVRGHSGEEGNEAADYLARRGTTHPLIPEKDWEERRQRVEDEVDRLLRRRNAPLSEKNKFNVQVEMANVRSFSNTLPVCVEDML